MPTISVRDVAPVRISWHAWSRDLPVHMVGRPQNDPESAFQVDQGEHVRPHLAPQNVDDDLAVHATLLGQRVSAEAPLGHGLREAAGDSLRGLRAPVRLHHGVRPDAGGDIGVRLARTLDSSRHGTSVTDERSRCVPQPNMLLK